MNDADYQVHTKVVTTIDGKEKTTWVPCPIYRTWLNMLSRCYNPKTDKTYEGCSVDPSWLKFSCFRAWVVTQDWAGKQLDKDILVEGNKLYSPETCVFVEAHVNTFLLERQNSNTGLPLGVHISIGDSPKFLATISDKCKKRHLGSYNTPKEAHKAWCRAKLEAAKILVSTVTDERVAKAVVARYETYLNRCV